MRFHTCGISPSRTCTRRLVTLKEGLFWEVSQSGDNEGGGGRRFLLTLASHGSQNVRNVDAFAINRNELGYRKNKKKSHRCQQCQECPNLRLLFGAMLGSLSLHVVMVANFPLVSQYYTVQPPTLISQDSRNINKPVSLFNLN